MLLFLFNICCANIVLWDRCWEIFGHLRLNNTLVPAFSFLLVGNYICSCAANNLAVNLKNTRLLGWLFFVLYLFTFLLGKVKMLSLSITGLYHSITGNILGHIYFTWAYNQLSFRALITSIWDSFFWASIISSVYKSWACIVILI